MSGFFVVWFSVPYVFRLIYAAFHFCLTSSSSPDPFIPFATTQRFNPKFATAEMRSRLTDGHPEDPLIIYVGRLGAEKRLRDLKGVLERWVGVWGRHKAREELGSTLIWLVSSCSQYAPTALAVTTWEGNRYPASSG